MSNPFKHFTDDFGITAWVATLIIIGTFAILFKVADRISPEAIVALVGGWVSGILTAYGMLKSAKNKQKEP
ncbi:MAG: hypothetical protein Q7J56_02685 [Deltaproteobacteria bacterium]|nr:hypothetical protein [Deltaproteobacteria bacterium]